MADISKIKPNGATGTEYDLKDATARAAMIPSGGTQGQVLVKKTGTDYDTEWATDVEGNPSGSATSGDLTKIKIGQNIYNVPDTTYTSKAAQSGGTDVSLVTTGEKYTWNEKVSKSSTAGLLKNDGTVDTNTYLTEDDIADKADKVISATNGDLAGLDSNGNLTDSGIASTNVVVKSITSGLVKNDGTIDTTTLGAVSANTSAITGIKDGQSLDSFGDVETALAGKMPNYGIGIGLYVDSYTNQLRADAVTKAIKDSPKLITSGAVFSGLSPKYSTAEQEETDLDVQDKFPFYDFSASAKRQVTFGNIKAKLKEYFDSLYTNLVSSATSGNFAGLDSNGNITDSGSKASDFSTVKTRQTPTSGGTDLSLVNTGDMYNWNNKTNTSVKGNAESSYRTGQVNITPANIGLGNVGNFKAVSTVASQGLTDTEKANARANIGAGTSSFSGSYNDLSNKPTIPAAQVNSDWNSTTGVSQILNKPNIPSISNCYQSSDTIEATLADDDKVPFYDTSVSGKRNSTWSNIKAKLKSYFDTLYTGNTGTVTSVVTGAGLTGGTITGSGTIKAKLQSETKSPLTAATRFATENREYAVGLDASGNLSVNVPWEDPVKRIILTNDSSTTLYYEIYTYEGYDETCPLWISGTLGTYANAGAAFPFCISVDIEQGKIKGFVSSGLSSSLDILVRRTTNTTVVCVALGLQWSKADLLVKTPTQGTLNTNPTPRSAYSFPINDRLSNLAKLPTTPLKQDVTLSISTATTVTFSDNSITLNSIIDYFCSEWGIVPDNITVSNSNCIITMPKVSSAKTVTIGIFVR